MLCRRLSGFHRNSQLLSRIHGVLRCSEPQGQGQGTGVRNFIAEADDDTHAVISVFDMFSIGIGPSSSHTVGPMRAAKLFVDDIAPEMRSEIHSISCELFGSLACTGHGHGTPDAIMMGLEGQTPEDIDPHHLRARTREITRQRKVNLNCEHEVKFNPKSDMVFRSNDLLPLHSNGMRLWAYDQNRDMLASSVFYSIGGGFVVRGETNLKHNEFYKEDGSREETQLGPVQPVHTFSNNEELLRMSRAFARPISGIVRENEKTWRSDTEITEKLLKIWSVMDESIENGIRTRGILPGKLKVTRRAAGLHKSLSSSLDDGHPLRMIKENTQSDLLSCWAIAVNEENACGGKVVTAPTNGAAGIIPAVLKFYTEYAENPTDEGIVNFLLTAGAIGMLYKRGASLSAAEVGCQGEVGVAASMAAGGLAEILGGTPEQVSNAAEIAMEHSLGLTCDPIEGLVQIPCIERNAMGANKAISAARLSLLGDGRQLVTLDNVIETMKQTGADMKHTYKETALAGLAVNVPVC